MTTARQYAFTEQDVKDPTQLAYLLNRLLSVTLSLKDTLDTIPDGVTFKKVTGVVAGQVTQTSIGNNAIGTPQLIANSVTAAKLSVAQLSAITADMGTLTAGVVRDINSKFTVDLANVLLTVVDAQGAPATRVRLGKLGGLSTDYGIEVKDSAGNIILSASGLGVDVVGNAQIQNNAVGTSELIANAVTAAKIAAHTITANEITAATITATEIAATTITAGKLVAHTITANEIAAGTITATEIAATTITAGKLVAHTITANEIAAATITATEIAAATITGAKIAATTIAASNIVAGTITANEIAATTITAAKLNISTLSAIAADVGTLNAGKIQNAGATAGILLSGALPGGWTTYLDLTASGANPLLHHAALDLNANGTANFSGTVSASSFTAATATFKDITQDWGGGTNATHKMFELGGNEAVRATASSIGGVIQLWGAAGNNSGEYIQFIEGGSIANPAAGNYWTIGQPTSQDLYVALNGTTLFKFNSVGSFQAPSMGTTASGSNCNINNASSNQFLRSTSSLRYKTDVRALAPTGAEDLIRALAPIVFKSTSAADDPEQDFLGLAAEDVAALDPRFVFLDEKGRPDGVQYDRLVVPIISVVQQLSQRLSALETRLAA